MAKKVPISMPSTKSLQSHAMKNGVAGAVGGLATGIGSNFGVLGIIVTGILAGAVTKNDAVTVNAVMDAVSSLFRGE